MAVFLSENNTEPYRIIDTLNYPIIDSIVYNTEGLDDIIVKEGYFYLIFEQGEVHHNVKVQVSLDYELGVALEIAKTDLVGNPIDWGTEILIGDVDASDSTQKFLLAYRWKIINNIYIVKPGEKVAIVRVVADD